MFNSPEYKVQHPAVFWSYTKGPSEDDKIKIWNDAIQAAMLALYEEGHHNEIVMPLKALLK